MLPSESGRREGSCHQQGLEHQERKPLSRGLWGQTSVLLAPLTPQSVGHQDPVQATPPL